MITGKHHEGRGVDDLEAEIKQYEAKGFKVSKRFTKPGMKAALLFKGIEGIELFQFDNPGGELEQKINKHKAFVSDDLDDDVQHLINQGYELAIPISPGTITKRFAYLRDKTGNYVELLEPLD